MKITVRLIVSLLLAAALVASVFSYYQVQNERDALVQELNIRANVLGESMQESVKEYVQSNAHAKLKRMVERFGNRARLIGIAVYDSLGGCLFPALRCKRCFHRRRLKSGNQLHATNLLRASKKLMDRMHIFLSFRLK